MSSFGDESAQNARSVALRHAAGLLHERRSNRVGAVSPLPLERFSHLLPTHRCGIMKNGSNSGMDLKF